MATRIRTLNFLPEIFKTTTNSQFLQATLDQLVAQPSTKRIEGYIGSTFGYGVNAKNKYVIEPTKVRTDYQLDPGVVFLKENDTTANDFISYPGIIDALKLEGAITDDNNKLFTSQFYSWDSFTDLDKIINFNQYYWLPEGPDRVVISSDIIYNSVNFIVVDQANDYLISSDINPVGTPNPTLTLLRGGTYTFNVNQDTQFWIQGEPGVTGYSLTQPNVQTRDVYGVTNNGATNGLVTFVVPEKNALDQYNFPLGPSCGVVSDLPFSQVNGAIVSDIGGIDGVTALDGLTVMFYNTGVDDEYGFVTKFYDQTLYDEETINSGTQTVSTDSGPVTFPVGGSPYVYPGTELDQLNFDGGYFTEVSAYLYNITILPGNVIQLTPASLIPTNQKIIPSYGVNYGNRGFYRNVAGSIQLIPYNSAILDELYYQDGSSATKVGIIRLVDNNITNEINVLTQILGKKTYTAPNGVVFTNGLKVLFQGNVYPESYNNVEYYVEGVGTAIELIPVESLVSPGLFTEGVFIPWDTTPYDIGSYDSALYIPVEQDYITIARNAINRNAWSRSNRWFHIDVINATAEYNNDPTLVTAWATTNNKAKRPIIEFYPNLRLFDSGVLGKDPIDYIDTRTTDAFTQVAGLESYYPDVAGYSTYNASIEAIDGPILDKVILGTQALTNLVLLNNTTGLYVNDTITVDANIGNLIQYVPDVVPPTAQQYYITEISGNNIRVSLEKQGTPVTLSESTGPIGTTIYPHSTTVTAATADLAGLFEVGQYIIDSTGILPAVAYITDISIAGNNTIILVEWETYQTIAGTSVASVVTADTPLSNYALFDGARIVFAADTNLSVRNKIYISRFSTITPNTTPVITLTEAPQGDVLPDEQTAVYRGYNDQGKDFYFDGIEWFAGQQKIDVNQPPYFDIFDSNGISLGDGTVYVGTSFTGSKLFSYGLGVGADDPIIGFPLRYSSIDNVGDISFDVTLNSQTFNYVSGTEPITENVNTGYVYNYTDRIAYTRQLGWQTAVSPSVQYQIFEFDWFATTSLNTFNCDVTPMSSTETNWPIIQVYINNNYIDPANYTVTSTDTSTTVTIPTISAIDTVVQILILSNQVSSTAYYGIPINLSNNPFNEDVTTVNIGDIRGQYQSIFYNNPNTTGEIFGPNNYRDLGNMVPWGNRIIQNSAAMALPGTFLRKQNLNLFNSLLYNSRQYITFKTLLVDTINNANYSTRLTPAQMLDDAMDQITSNKTDSQPFFWSDMLPSKSAYISNTYSFANSLDVSIYPLTRVYNFTTANYYGVLVYLIRNGVTTQLITGVDYTVSTTAPSLTVTTDLLPNDQIVVNEYNQTYGSYVPNTPTKLGLYPSTIPAVTLDTAYTEPTYFIVGHDGSFTKLYGNYDPQTSTLDDYRDQVLLEYETRVYNNLKLSNVIPIELTEILPGFFRTTDYTYDEFLQIYSESFLNWVGENRINYKRQLYNSSNPFTYNYDNNSSKIGNTLIEQGYFRGLYLYYYDTSTPDTTPWQMIGYANEPTWWTSRYGAAPYTSDNLVLWGDMAAGIDWNNGNPVVIPKYIRDGLLNVIPVDSNGDLLPPTISILGNYNARTFNRDWKVGDVGPAEFSYRRSSTWVFDLMRILALTRPAAFYNLAVDIDHYKYNVEFNQFLVNDRSHLNVKNIPIYGTGTPATSYINWIVDYEKQAGVDATTNITTLLDNLDVRLIYRVAGFSDKDLLQFYVEKSSANSNNSSLLIPDESYQVLLYDNQPFDKIVYSGVVIQISENGYKVFGNSQTNAYFKVLVPKNNGITESITVENLTVKLATEFYDRTVLVPYGTEFYSVQEVAQFLNSYGKYLESQGVVFEQIENAIPVNWPQMVAEYMYWTQMGWELGSITTINPAATLLSIDRDSYIVQPLTLRQQNFVLNQNLYPIQSTDLSIVREGTLFTAQPLNQGDAISYGQFNISNFEHGIVFNNVTLFNDIIYNLITGLRQNRIFVRGAKTAEWNGTVDAYGFILNQDNIQQWSSEYKYTKGAIVLYKNRYWSALTIVQAKQIFDERDWKEIPYGEIQKGLLPNSQTRSYESSLYYSSTTANLEKDADLLSFSLIGYRPRDYLAIANLTDITQVSVYKNMIKEKGTLNAASAFKGATLPQGGIDYDIYENWAIKSGEYGGVLNNNFIEVRLQESVLTGNPSIVGLTNGVYTEGVQQEIPLYSIFNYGRPINSPDVLPTISPTEPSSLLPTAGYVNYNDVKMSSYFYSGLSNARDASGVRVPINRFYVRDYVWLANYLADWQVYTPVSLGSIINAKNNLNGTVTITFSQAHNLTKYQLFAILNFNTQINNYYIVAGIVDPFRVVINLSLSPTITNLTGQGVGFRMQSQRVASAPEIADLPSLIDNEFNRLKVWVDTNNDGSWAVFRKTLNYQYDKEILRNNSQSFGSAVAYTPLMSYLIGDAEAGEVYRYAYDINTDSYIVDQTITHGASFGSTITYVDDFFVISEPTGSPNVYVYQLITTTLVNDVLLYQTIPAPGGVTNWGSTTALSGDKNWLYISDINNNSVYVYRKSDIPTNAGNLTIGQPYTISSLGTTDFTLIGASANVVGTMFVATGVGTGTGVANLSSYQQSYIIDGDALSLTSAGDKFGYSIATDYYGDTVVIGAPFQNYDVNTENYGYAYAFARTVQNFEVQSTSQSYVPQLFNLTWNPATETQIATATDGTTERITVTSSAGFSVGDPVVFTGALLSAGAIAENTVYYVYDKPTITTFRIATTRDAVSPVNLATDSGSMTCTIQTSPLYVSVNGTLIEDNTYAVVGSTLYIYSSQTPTLNAGDIVNASGSNFVLSQTLTNEETPRVGVEFGTSIDTNNFANEILVGAPFELNDKNQEGAVNRYTNGGEKYGIIIGTQDCNITTARTILLNGYSVTLPIGNATVASNAINAANITNVTSTTIDGKLVIQLVDVAIGVPSNKLSLTVLNSATLAEMGVTLYTQTQKILCPHASGSTQFGSVIKFNEQGSFVASAPTGIRNTATTFDFTDDELDNDTVFDNNATQWVDTFTNAGAVYMFDYLSAYNESLNNPGKFVYAQSTNAQNLDYGAQPMYGQAIDFNNNRVIVGTPNFNPVLNAENTNGQVISYISASSEPDWSVYRSSAPIVDINSIGPIQLFSASTNNTLENLDYFDPLQGKLLGAVQENIDVISNSDPAAYNNPGNTQRGLVWGASQVGQLWFNTSNTRFVNYHQNDVTYNSQYWGRVFTGSDVAIYSWIVSDVPPTQYAGPGTPFNINTFAVHAVLNTEGTVVPVYYYWVRNTNIVFDQRGKTLADSTIQSYIAQPQNAGISYFAPLQSNVFGLYNSSEYINANDTVLHIGYATGSNDDVSYNQFSLIRAGYPDDFLDGLPGSGAAYQSLATVGINQPIGLYNRMLDSLSGVDPAGAVVPNPFLPKAVQSGVLARPRQSFFYNRYGALKNYLQYANTVLAQFPIMETRNSQFLYKVGEINPSTVDNPNWSGPALLFFDTPKYWNLINWWAPGYNDNTRATLQVPIYADLATLDVDVGTIVTVAANGAGNSETYIYEATGTWTRIGLTNGTIEFSNYLWDYSAARLGWGDNFFDTTPYDTYPSEETRYIIRALNEEIYTNELLEYRNKSLILLFEYIQSETIESQNYLPWLNKTSFIDVSHTIRELRPIEVFQSDYQDFLSGYLNEVKPYHVVIKEFLFKYTGIDVFEGDITDFDLPAQWSSSTQTFITPELEYANSNNVNEFLPTDPIWQNPSYSQWYQNYGLSIVGQNAYPISILESYVSLNSSSLYVTNANGFPVAGTILIGTELITYNSIDLATNRLSGLFRGAMGTEVQVHIPGEQIIIDLPAVLVLNTGRAYINPPLITANIDTTIYPAPRVPAQLEAIMSLDKVIGVNVINPGSGYAVLPTIDIQPALVVNVPSTSINLTNSTIELTSAVLQTGDLVVYNIGPSSTQIGGLAIGQRYYVKLLEATPSPIIALYSTYIDAVNDHNRIVLISTGTGTQTLSVGAYASCVTSATPVRENNITLRFDRTSYTSKVVDWEPAGFYGSFFAGEFSDDQIFSSSSIKLYSTDPPIGGILAGETYGITASAEGGTFQILDVENDQTLTWSSRTRDTVQTYGDDYPVVAYQNAIRINPSTGGAEVAGEIGSTIGFYIGMPIKFVGAVPVGSPIVSSSPSVDNKYYVESLVQLPSTTSVGATTLEVGYKYSITTLGTTDFTLVGASSNTVGLEFTATGVGTGTGTAAIMESTGFTISDTVDVNGNPGSVLVLNTAPVPTAGLLLYVGNLTNTAVMTINYNSLRNASATTATNNTVTVDLTVTGQDGTTEFFTGLPIFFVGTEFGGIIENRKYYVNAVIDSTSFTMTETNNPTIIYCTATTGTTGNLILCPTTFDLSVNDPVIFNGMGIAGNAVSNFGGIESGTTYYIKDINNGSFTLSESIDGPVFVLTDPPITASNFTIAPMLLQTEVVQLTNATGSMQLNINNGISPGQINGQQFTLYGQTGPYTNVTGDASNLIDRVITSTLDVSLTLPTPSTEYRICLSTVSGGTTSIYANMEFDVSKPIGGLTTSGGPYIVTDIGTTQVNISFVQAGNAYDPDAIINIPTGNWLTVTPTVEYPDTTDALYEGMPLYFTGESLGGVSLNTVYYVYEIGTGPDAGKIRISEDVGLSQWYQILNNQGGIMLGTGEKYVEVSDALTNAISTDDTTMLTQYVDPLDQATFDVSGILGGYTASIVSPGSGYALNNVITILGTDLGGTTTTNDLTLTVSAINSTGGVMSTITSGTPIGLENKYYLKVTNQDQVEVYSDPNMKVAVSGQNFPYVGATVTTATAIDGSTERITVTSSAQFAVNDLVVFTGNMFGGANLVAGQPYYIASKPTSTTVTISNTIGGSAVNLTTSTGTMTMAKSGDYAVLPQPFYFDPSVVRYRNNVYQCIISNNDSEFIVGKWELLSSGSRKLNALDRIVGYYKPNKTDTEAWNQYINMPGDDLTQLVSGITYPNSTYLGNAFPPAEEYALDTILVDQPFYPTGINLKAITYGDQYIAGSDTSDTSIINTSIDSVDWTVKQLTNTSIGVTDIIYTGSKYVITTTNNATPVLISDNGIEWDSTITYVPISNVSPLLMNGVDYANGTYIAVGNNIILSTDLSTWTEVFKFPNNGLTNTFNDVAYVNTGGFNGFVAVGLGQRYVTGQATNTAIIYFSVPNYTNWVDNQFNSTIYGLNAIASNGQTIVAVGDNGIIYTSFNALVWNQQTSPVANNLNSIIWDSYNNLFIAVGDNGTIITAPIDGASWTVRTSGTTEDLTSLVYNNVDGEYVAVGFNNTVVRTNDAESTWTNSANFETLPTVYTVQGDEFTAGYGPEEMVPGVVTDTVTMITATRPGTNWDETIYQHVGYNVVTREIDPTSGIQTEYSFVNTVETPSQISVFVINRNTGLSTSIYDGIDYTVDWVNKIVTLDTPITYVPAGVSDKLRIDVYETGNGDQLVKANTETDPIRDNTVTGFQEIYVNANYTAGIYQGSGVIRPTTEPQEVTAIATSEITDAITCVSVEDFVLNGVITFSGAVFGNIIEDQVYYVKTISYVSNRITISEVYNTSTGTAGATFSLSTATGSMKAIIQVGTGTVWTPPIVYHNGVKLVLGHTATVTRTRSSTNTVTTNTTGDLVPNQKIKFSNTIFGGILPLETYYIKQIIDGNEFTISETEGGPVFALTTATGGAMFVSADYAIGIAENGISASLLLANEYDISVDYLTYTLFGETVPLQYGYTIPETQLITADGTVGPFSLDNYVSGNNPLNAIVEVNRLRVDPSTYTIDPIANEIEFNLGDEPANSDTIAVTSYNLTDRQYFNTQVVDTTGVTVSAISNINNAITEPSTVIICSGTNSANNSIVCNTTANLVDGQEIIFKSIVPDSDYEGSGIDTTGKVYYILDANVSGTEFTISETPSGTVVTVTTVTANMVGYVGGNLAIRVTTTNSNNLVDNDFIRIDGVLGSIQLNNNTYYAKVISATEFYLYSEPYNPALGTVNYPVTFASAYVSGGYVWLDQTFIITDTTTIATTASNNRITVDDNTGIVTGTPIYFTEQGAVTGTTILSNIKANTEYYVLDANPETSVTDLVVGYAYSILGLGTTTNTDWNTIAGTSGVTYIVGDTFVAAATGTGTGTTLSLQEFTISEQRYPDESEFVLTNDTGSVLVTQFQQVNVDRLWVTVNGYRVPSSSLRINEFNNLSILTTIASGDEVIITSMMPTATPNEEVYLLNVSTTNQAAVYRANTQTRTWLVQPLRKTDTTIYLNDASHVTSTIIQNVTAPAAVAGKTSIGLTANKNVICHVTIYNNTTIPPSIVNPSNYSLSTFETAPIVVITDGVSEGDSLTITTLEGRLLYINGEQIGFDECDIDTNTVSGLTRGANGTGAQADIPLYSEVYGIIPENRMTDVVYSSVWNSNIYNTVEGDPLQISQTVGANFLKVDRN